jgi:hypothetical protein
MFPFSRIISKPNRPKQNSVALQYLYSNSFLKKTNWFLTPNKDGKVSHVSLFLTSILPTSAPLGFWPFFSLPGYHQSLLAPRLQFGAVHLYRILQTSHDGRHLAVSGPRSETGVKYKTNRFVDGDIMEYNGILYDIMEYNYDLGGSIKTFKTSSSINLGTQHP